MKNFLPVFIFFCLLSQIIVPLRTHAQMIWPGDINNNGIVNGIDLLYLGSAYNAGGPTREDASINWFAQTMGESWSRSFPGETNFAYADLNGNGVVNDEDFNYAYKANMGKTHGSIIPDQYSSFLLSDDAAIIRMTTDEYVVAPGSQVHIIIELGTQSRPVQDFHGVAFTLSYDPTAVLGETFEGGFYANAWTNPSGFIETRTMVHNNPSEGEAEFALTRIVPSNDSGYGDVASFSFFINDNAGSDTIYLKLDQFRMINMEMENLPVGSEELRLIISPDAEVTNNCPSIVSPVCGADGTTYLNSCLAEAAGVMEYTVGVCFGDCIDPDEIDTTIDCPSNFDPVCGCNGITYLNSCEAESFGIQTYTEGPCSTADNCYDTDLIIGSSGTTVNNGVIELDCPTTQDPVCGCNGVTYDNACVAEASGISFYTVGPCSTVCVDPAYMDPDANCGNTYDPVCGCNGVTYTNSCYADAAGVVSYSSGVCGNTSAWCSEATPIQCGDFLASETTIGTGNHISAYPGCAPGTFLGPDKVYVFNKTTAGDLQIGLEILTPNLDLDLFLLAANCSQVTCLGKSTTSNNLTNNEGILLEDAPIGTYYIVVDAQFANAQGNFHLEVSCGYLSCADAESLTCGVPFYGNNGSGNDEVSLYGCDGNIYNVENNGPEVVHTFTTTSAGAVNISMTGLSANLELFLLRSCDRGDCVTYSQNSGTNDEHISTVLPAGTYYVVVDGYNGAVSDYTLTVDCNSSCNLSLNLTSTDAGCGLNNGVISVVSSGGTPGFVVFYSGPVSGSFSTISNSCTISNLPAGTYTITKIDVNGCSVTGTITVGSEGGLGFNATPSPAACMDEGSIQIHVYGGTPLYHVYVTGPVNGNFTVASNNFTIDDLPGGAYTIYITDSNGCTATQVVIVNEQDGGFDFVATPNDADCGGLGSIHIATSGGISPYTVSVQGPVSGYAIVGVPNFNIINLPGGVYTVTVEDGNWCTHTETVIVETGSLDVSATPITGACGSPGAIALAVSNGSPTYHITWDGPVDGSVTTANPNYLISNLPGGVYQITVLDNNGCSDYLVVAVDNSADELNINVVPIAGDCGELGAIWIDIYNGTPGYVISWTGPESGSIIINANGTDIPDLTPGTYTVSIMDAGGCSSSQTVILGGNGDLGIDLNSVLGDCGTESTIEVLIDGGTANYIITWNGPVSGSAITSNTAYYIQNLAQGSYTVTVTDASGCTASSSFYLNIGAGSDVEIVANALNGLCDQPGAIWLSVNGGTLPYTASWSGPVNGTKTFNSNGTSIQNLPAGTYILTVVDANGCSDSETITINVNNGSFNMQATPVGGGCAQNGSIIVDLNGGSGPYTIQWSGPVGGSVNTNSGGYVINNLPGGTYTITAIDENGCTDVESVYLFDGGNTINVSAIATDGNCESNGSIHVDISGGSAPYVVVWNGPIAGTITIVGNSLDLTDLPEGTYSITVTDGSGCSDLVVVTVNNPESSIVLSASVAEGNCGAEGSVFLTIDGGNSPYWISWTGPENGTISVNSNSTTIQNLSSGTYTFTVEDENDCTESIYVTINNAESDLEVVGFTTNETCDESNSIQLNILNGTPSYLIQWSGPIGGSTISNSNIFSLNDIPPGTYYFTVTDDNGCTDTETVTVQVFTNDLVVNAALIVNECNVYNTIWVDITGGDGPYIIQWIGPENGSVNDPDGAFEIEDLPPGVYIIKVTDYNGCMVTQEITIYQSGINLIETTVTNGICGSLGQIFVNIITGTGPYQLTWMGPASGTVTVNGGGFFLSNLPSGSYMIMVEDAIGCADSEVVQVNNQENNVEISLTVPENNCDGEGYISVGISGGAGNYTITWSGPESGSTVTTNSNYNINNLNPGTYLVQVTDANGCSDQESIVVETADDDLDLIITPVPGVCGLNGSLWLDILGGTAPYLIGWTGPVSGSTSVNTNGYNIPNLPSGTYIVTITDANGCTVSVSATLVNSGDDFDIAATSNSGICGSLGSAHLVISGGQATYTVSWTGPVSGSTTTNNNTFNLSNLPSGNYIFTVTDANGCVDSEPIYLNNLPDDLDVIVVPTPAVCEPTGSIHVGITGGTPSYTITWSGPVSGSVTIGGVSYNILNLPGGTYTVTVTDSNGCTETHTVVVQDLGNDLEVSAAIIINDCGVYNTIWVDITGGTGPYIIMWTGPESGQVSDDDGAYEIPDLPPGTYTVKITDANNCMVTTTVIIYESDIDIFDATVENGICGDLGHIILNFTGGTSPYIVTMSGPVSGSSMVFNPTYVSGSLPSGTYLITIEDAIGCFDSETVVVNNQENDVDLFVNVPEADCGELGQIDVVISGGSGAYTLTWTGPESGSIVTNNTNYTLNNLPGGTYTLEVTDANGCSDAESVYIEMTPDDLDLIITPVPGVCGQNGSLWLDFIGGQAPYTIVWTGPVSGSTVVNTNGYNIPNLPSGTYTVTVTDANGCTVTEIGVLVNDDTDFDVTLTSNNGGCGELGSVNLIISGGTANYTISWNGPVGGTTTTSNNSFNLSNLPSGNYTFTITDATGCVDTEVAYINNFIDDLDVIAVPTSAVCDMGGMIHIGIVGGTPDYTITWSGPESGSVVISGVSYNIQDIPPGLYTITVTDANGCTEVENVVVANIDSDLDVSAALIINDCGVYNTIWVDITGGVGPYIIIWTGPESGQVTDDDGAFEITDLPPGTYTIKVTDQIGCMIFVTVIVYESDVDLFDVTPVNGDCGDLGQAIVDITATAPYTISWSGPVSGSVTTSALSYIIENLPSGTYTVNIQDAMGCFDSEVITINNEEDVIDITVNVPEAECGESGTIGVSISGGNPNYILTWTGPVSGSTTFNGVGYDITGLPGGTYQLQVTDSEGCTASESVVVDVPEDDLVITTTISNSICDAPGSILVSIAGGDGPYLLDWSGPISGTASVNGNSFNITNLIAGVYSIVVTDDAGCSDSETVVISNIISMINIAAVVNNGLCGEDGAINLTFTGGTPIYTVSWTGPESGTSNTTGFITLPNLTSGAYNITVTDANGCTESETVVVNNGGNNLAATHSTVAGICGADGSIFVNITTGQAPFTINWTGPESGSATTNSNGYNISGLSEGGYTITITDANGCTKTLSATVNVQEDNLSVLFMMIDGVCGQTGSVQVIITSGDPDFTISWSGPVNGSITTSNTTYTISNLVSGMYSIIVADGNGCSETETVIIDNGSNDLDIVPTAINGVCAQNGAINISILNGAGPYSINWNGPVSSSAMTNSNNYNIPNLPGGVYTIFVTDDNGCTTSENVVVNVSPGVNLIASAANGVCGDLGSINLVFNNGTPDYTVSWSGPVSNTIVTSSGTLTIPNLLEGTYTITVTDANGCTDTESVTLVNTDDGLDVIFTPLHGACGELGSIWIDILNGSPWYIISWTGTTTGSEVTNQDFYDIPDLPSGTYTVTVIDANDCSETIVITLVNIVDDLVTTINPQSGSCNGPGRFTVSMTGGTPDYTIEWSSAGSSGSVTTSNSEATVNDLPTGIYSVSVTDINGCEDTFSFQLLNNGNNLDMNASPVPFNCGIPGYISLNFTGGNPDYTIEWMGPTSGSTVVSGDSYTIDNLTMGVYMVTVTDGYGCSKMESVFVGEMTEAPTASFTHSISDLTVSFNNTSTSGNFVWDFGDGTNTTQGNPTHTYLSAGTYTVCLSATNGCGSDSFCQTITVAGPDDMVILDIGEKSGTTGSSIFVPVMIENCDKLVSLSGSVSVFDGEVADIVGVAGAKITPQFNIANQTFNFYDNNGTGINLVDGDTLFYFVVDLTGAPGESTLIELTNSPLMSEVGGFIGGVPSALPHIRLAGQVTISQTGQISGGVTTYWAEGIEFAEVTMGNDDMSLTVETDENGQYAFPDMPTGSTYEMSAGKDMNPENGLSTYGLFIGQRFLLGVETPQITSPYQIIAADANCSGSFSTLDLFVIQQLIIGVNDDFDHCPSWVFVAEGSDMPVDFDAYNVFPYQETHSVVMTDGMVKNFIGVKVGDILGHANPNMLHVEDIDDRDIELLRLQAPNQSVKTGEIVELTFSTEDFERIASYQMELLFDNQRLSYLDFAAPAQGPLASAMAGISAADEGSLRISWFDLQGNGVTLNEKAEVFTLRFEAKAPIDDMSGLFTLNSTKILSEAHIADGDPVKLVLEFVDPDGGTIASKGYSLHQNMPNPFQNITKIGFELPEAMDAEVIIHDHLGRVIDRISGYYDRGYNQVVWNRANAQSGVYYYTLKTKDYTATKNMILLD